MVFVPCADLVFYLLGSGEYDELACADTLRSLIAILKDLLGKPPSAGVLLDKYTKLAVIVDEVINEVRGPWWTGGDGVFVVCYAVVSGSGQATRCRGWSAAWRQTGRAPCGQSCTHGWLSSACTLPLLADICRSAEPPL